MKQVKCENCGANIDETICPYCNTRYNLDKKEIEENVLQQVNNTTPLDRPKISVGLTVFLFIFYWPVGLIYLISKKQKQKKWDKEHKKD